MHVVWRSPAYLLIASYCTLDFPSSSLQRATIPTLCSFSFEGAARSPQHWSDSKDFQTFPLRCLNLLPFICKGISRRKAAIGA